MRKGWLAACSGLALAVMTGCGDGDPAAPTIGEADAVVTGGTVEFEDRFSDTGRFLVARSASGELAMAVQDAIGKRNGLVEATAGMRTVKDIYSVLRPNQSVPKALAQLTDKLDAIMANAQQPTEDPPQVMPASDTDALVFKNESTFNATVCKDIPNNSSSVWRKRRCAWRDAYKADAYCYVSGNRSYAWNEMSESSKHSLDPCPSAVKFTVAAYTYQWAQWNTSCYCPGARVMGMPDTGSCGVTIHALEPIIK